MYFGHIYWVHILRHFLFFLSFFQPGMRQCPICYKTLSSLSYKMHMDAHNKIYRYRCPYCNKGFNATNSLKSHVSWHTGIKEYACELCGKEYRNNSNLTAHMRDVHGCDNRIKWSAMLALFYESLNTETFYCIEL